MSDSIAGSGAGSAEAVPFSGLLCLEDPIAPRFNLEVLNPSGPVLGFDQIPKDWALKVPEVLHQDMQARETLDPRYFTPSQVREYGLKVADDAQPLLVRMGQDTDEQAPSLKLFSAQSILNIPMFPDLTPALSDEEPAWTLEPRVQKMLDVMGLGLRNDARKPSYSPTMDTVHMPPPHSYISAPDYYHDLFRQVAMATGAPGRLKFLDRPLLMWPSDSSRMKARLDLMSDFAAHHMSHDLAMPDQAAMQLRHIGKGATQLLDDPQELILAQENADLIALYVAGRAIGLTHDLAVERISSDPRVAYGIIVHDTYEIDPGAKVDVDYLLTINDRVEEAARRTKLEGGCGILGTIFGPSGGGCETHKLPPEPNKVYTGRVLHADSGVVYQKVGTNKVVLHDRSAVGPKLNLQPGHFLKIEYGNTLNTATVTDVTVYQQRKPIHLR